MIQVPRARKQLYPEEVFWGLVQVENKGPRLWWKFYFKKKHLKVLHGSAFFVGVGVEMYDLIGQLV